MAFRPRLFPEPLEVLPAAGAKLQEPQHPEVPVLAKVSDVPPPGQHMGQGREGIPNRPGVSVPEEGPISEKDQTSAGFSHQK